MEELDEILTELYLTVKEKRKAILSQKYESAARLRDTEKQLEDKLCKKLFVADGIIPGYSMKIESLDKYFQEIWGVEYSKLFDEDTFKQFKREITLKRLGI